MGLLRSMVIEWILNNHEKELNKTLIGRGKHIRKNPGKKKKVAMVDPRQTELSGVADEKG